MTQIRFDGCVLSLWSRHPGGSTLASGRGSNGAYDREFAGPGLARETALRLLGDGPSTERHTKAPGISPDGLWTKVGGKHMPLGLLVRAILDAGLDLERFEEPQAGQSGYPNMLALACRR
jgi:hypothetical protein